MCKVSSTAKTGTISHNLDASTSKFKPALHHARPPEDMEQWSSSTDQ